MSYTDLMEVYKLWQAGEAAYGVGLHRLASDHYRQATELAKSLEGEAAWFRGVLIRSLADELTTLERLREALAVLSSIPKAAEGGFRACCVYGSMTDQIEVAQRIPVALAVIERAYAQAEDYFRSAGDASWRGRLLYYRSELLYDRGLYAQALAAAQEGAARLREDCPKLYASDHMYGLFRISLALGDTGGAKRYLERWVERYDKEDKHNAVRGSYEYVMRSRLARAEGRAEDSFGWSSRGARWLESADWGHARFELSCERARSYILAGRHSLARGLLARMAHARHSESAHRRYAFALLRGDYYLARVRASLGLAQLDEEFETRGASATDTPAACPLVSEASKARRAYGVAMSEGTLIDLKLQCSFRAEEVTARLKRLAVLARAPHPSSELLKTRTA